MSMARKQRIHYPGALYHVISRGTHRQDIFLDRALAGQTVKEIAEHFRRSPMRISQAIIEMEERLHHDESLKRVVNRLEKDLSKDAKKKYFITIA